MLIGFTLLHGFDLGDDLRDSSGDRTIFRRLLWNVGECPGRRRPPRTPRAAATGAWSVLISYLRTRVRQWIYYFRIEVEVPRGQMSQVKRVLQMFAIRSVLLAGTATLLATVAMVPSASAQIAISINPPVCAYGYYDYSPYGCAPMGFYGPGYFYNGIFLGVGPWGNWGYSHGWGGHRFSGGGGGRYVAGRGNGGGGVHAENRGRSSGESANRGSRSNSGARVNSSHAAASHSSPSHGASHSTASRGGTSHGATHSAATHGGSSHASSHAAAARGGGASHGGASHGGGEHH